jgi:hypothetical protein
MFLLLILTIVLLREIDRQALYLGSIIEKKRSYSF